MCEREVERKREREEMMGLNINSYMKIFTLSSIFLRQCIIFCLCPFRDFF